MPAESAIPTIANGTVPPATWAAATSNAGSNIRRVRRPADVVVIAGNLTDYGTESVGRKSANGRAQVRDRSRIAG